MNKGDRIKKDTCFSENLKNFRKLNGYPCAKEFAKKLGIPYSSYMAYENKNREPKYDLLIKIANILDVTIDELLGNPREITTKKIKILEFQEKNKRKLFDNAKITQKRTKIFTRYRGAKQMNTRKKMRIKAFWQLPKRLRYKPCIRLMFPDVLNKSNDYICFHDIMKGRNYK